MEVTLFIDCFMCPVQVRPPWYAWTFYIGVLSLDKIINQVIVRTVGKLSSYGIMIIISWFLRDILLWNNNYISLMEQHLITAVTLRDYLHWIIKSSLFIGWWYTWTYISLFTIIIHLLQNAVIYVPEVTLCMDTLDKVVLRCHRSWLMKTLHVLGRIS